MKFDTLYSKIFEQENIDARPEDVEIEPAPVLTTPETTGGDTAKTLMDYVTVLDHAIASLNGTDTESLQRLIKSLDKPNTPFAGISEDLWEEINRAADSISSVTTVLKSYINMHSTNNVTPEANLEVATPPVE